MKRISSVILLLAAGFALLAAQPAAAGSFHGVVTQGPLTALDYQRMGNGHVGTLRLSLTWRSLEPTRGNRDFDPIEPIIAQAAANGVRVLPTIIGPGPRGTSHPPTNGASRRAFGKFAGALAGRFGRGGTFWRSQPRDVPITAYQIYNEQNGPAYWDARPSPRAYGKLVKAAANKITRKDRRAEIVLGGMFGTPQGDGARTSWGYLDALYEVRGIKKAFDTAAIHPYSPTLRGIKAQIKRFRAVMRANHDGRAKLRLTEAGWGSGAAGTSDFNKGTTGSGADADQALQPARASAEGVEDRRRQLVRLAGQPPWRLLVLPHRRPLHRGPDREALVVGVRRSRAPLAGWVQSASVSFCALRA